MASSGSSGGESLRDASPDGAPCPHSFPVGSRVDVWFPEDEEWFSASVLKKEKVSQSSRGSILCDYDLDGVIEWVALDDSEVRESSSTPPTPEPSDVDDPFPAGTKVEVFWKDDKIWYRGEVLKTRTEWHAIRGQKTLTRELFCFYELDSHMQWHSLHNNRVRRAQTGERGAWRGVTCVQNHVGSCTPLGVAYNRTCGVASGSHVCTAARQNARPASPSAECLRSHAVCIRAGSTRGCNTPRPTSPSTMRRDRIVTFVSPVRRRVSLGWHGLNGIPLIPRHGHLPRRRATRLLGTR